MAVAERSELVCRDRLGPDGQVVLLTLNRPDALNPIDALTVAELEVQLRALTTDRSVRAVAITGAGTAFSAGGDLKGYQRLFTDRDAFVDFMETFDRVCHLLERSRLVSAAMVNGTCLAGGLELALACDLVYIADDARIGDGHLRFAQLPGAGGSQRLVRSIGFHRARHWLLSGKLFSAAEAVQAGIAIAAVPADQLASVTVESLVSLTEQSELAIERMKDLIAVAATQPLDEGLQTERRIAADYATSSFDAREGLLAFAEKRTPRYKGR